MALIELVEAILNCEDYRASFVAFGDAYLEEEYDECCIEQDELEGMFDRKLAKFQEQVI